MTAPTVTHYLNGELRRLKSEWSMLTGRAPTLPVFTWEDLMEVLLEQATSELQEMVIRGALATLVKTAQVKPPDRILHEVLMLASSTSDLTVRRSALAESEVQMV